MTRILLTAAALALLAGCAQLQTGYEVVAEKVCAAPTAERFARKALFDSMTGRTEIVDGAAVYGYDCDDDSKPDNLGSWRAPAK